MATTRRDYRGLALDALAIGAVAALLVGIHVLVPAGLRHELALQYARPDPLHALTAAYVHLTDAHLVGNVGGLLAGGGWLLLVSWLADERRWARFSFAWFLTALPIAVGMTGAALVGGPLTTRGFSGVVAGLAGFGLVGVGVVLHRAYGVDRWLAWDVVAAVTVVVAAEILWLVTGTLSTAAGGLLALGGVATVLPIARAGYHAGLPADRDGWRRLVGAAVTAGLLGLLVVVFVVGLFPTDIASGESITNVLGHYLGLVYGAVIAGWGYRYWSTAPARSPENRRS
ncbi:MAG: hypothetical protein U5J98_00180 [Halobacteriales archaeon]|nr:hypothetical protein [Halobacteriales archaeon]